MKWRLLAQLDEEIPSLIKRRADIYKDQIRWFSLGKISHFVRDDTWLM